MLFFVVDTGDRYEVDKRKVGYKLKKNLPLIVRRQSSVCFQREGHIIYEISVLVLNEIWEAVPALLVMPVVLYDNIIITN